MLLLTLSGEKSSYGTVSIYTKLTIPSTSLSWLTNLRKQVQISRSNEPENPDQVYKTIGHKASYFSFKSYRTRGLVMYKPVRKPETSLPDSRRKGQFMPSLLFLVEQHTAAVPRSAHPSGHPQPAKQPPPWVSASRPRPPRWHAIFRRRGLWRF